ncbi:MAG: hypothetical protein ACLTSZ_03820 [Lachnospiraceae bacterium]
MLHDFSFHTFSSLLYDVMHNYKNETNFYSLPAVFSKYASTIVQKNAFFSPRSRAAGPGSCAAPDIRIQMQGKLRSARQKRKISHHRQASAKKPESVPASADKHPFLPSLCLRILEIPGKPVYRAKKGDQENKANSAFPT